MARSQIPSYAARISKMAGRRSKAWSHLASLWSADMADEVRSGRFGSLMRSYFSEIGQEALAIGPLMSLDVYSRAAHRRDRDGDIDAFNREASAFRDQVPLTDMETMTSLCRTESAMWAAGDIDGGRNCRRQEFALLESRLEEELGSACHAIVNGASTHVWRTLARLTLVFLETETGRQTEG